MRFWKLIRMNFFWLALLAAVSGSAVIIFLGMGLLHPRSALIPLADTDRSVVVDGLRMRYRVHGDHGPVIIFLHGFGGSLEEWEKVIAALPDARCYSLDLPGFGGSDRTLTDYTLDDQRRYLVAFMDALGIDRAVLAGRSMGASLAVWTAAKSKERVVGALLVAPSGYPGSLRYNWPASWVYRPGFCNRVVSFCIQNRFFGACFPLSLARQGVGITASYDEKFALSLGEVVQPVQLVWSPGDQRVPSQYAKIYQDRLADSRLTNLPESAGHDAGWKAPDEIAGALKVLLGRIAPGR